MARQTNRRAGRSAAGAPLLGEDTEAVLGEWLSSPSGRRPERPRPAARVEKPAPIGAARQAVPAAGYQEFSISPGSFASAAARGFLAAMARKATRSSGRQSRHAAGGDGAGRRRAARDAATGPLPGSRTPTWAAISSTRIPASAGISLNIRHPKASNRQGHDPRLRCRRRGVLAWRLAAPGLGYDVMKSIARTSSTSSNPAWARTAPMAGCEGRSSRGGVRRQAEMSGLPEPRCQ